MDPKVEQVFGINDDLVLSYIERPTMNGEFVRGLQDKKHIIIYGASKQGKSSLVNKHLAPEQFIRIDPGPKTTIVDIYTSIARQESVEIITSRTYGQAKTASVTAKASFTFRLPFVGES